MKVAFPKCPCCGAKGVRMEKTASKGMCTYYCEVAPGYQFLVRERGEDGKRVTILSLSGMKYGYEVDTIAGQEHE
jgi:hypothetical protein